MTVDEVFTIDELAAATGVPSRTIRQYQTLGLLAPPTRVGRVGRYGPAHRERLGAIARLQERGYSLAGMRDLFEAWEHGRPIDNVIGGSAHPEAPVDEAAMRITDAQLRAAAPALGTPANRRLAVQAGLIAERRDGRTTTGRSWFVRSPAGLAMVADLIANGVPPARAIGFYGSLRDGFAAAGREVATWLSREDDADRRAELLQRNRPLLGRMAATLLIDAVGSALPAEDVQRVRIGLVHRPGAPRPTPGART